MATRMLTVKNRSASRIVYKIPENNIRREFAPGEVKVISYEGSPLEISEWTC